MDALVEACISELALCPEPEVPLQALVSRVGDRWPYTADDAVASILAARLQGHAQVVWRKESDAYALDPTVLKELLGLPPSVKLSATKKAVLVAVARRRAAGISAIELARVSGLTPKQIFYQIKTLAAMGAVVRVPIFDCPSPDAPPDARILNTSLIVLAKCAPDSLVDLHSPQAGIVVHDVLYDVGCEVLHRTENSIMPQKQVIGAITDSLAHHVTLSTRTKREIIARMAEAGYITRFLARVVNTADAASDSGSDSGANDDDAAASGGGPGSNRGSASSAHSQLPARWRPCVQLVRRPDLSLAAALARDAAARDSSAAGGDDENSNSDNDAIGSDNEGGAEGVESAPLAQATDLVTLDVPILEAMFRYIQKAGTDGVLRTDLRQFAAGNHRREDKYFAVLREQYGVVAVSVFAGRKHHLRVFASADVEAAAVASMDIADQLLEGRSDPNEGKAFHTYGEAQLLLEAAPVRADDRAERPGHVFLQRQAAVIEWLQQTPIVARGDSEFRARLSALGLGSSSMIAQRTIKLLLTDLASRGLIRLGVLRWPLTSSSGLGWRNVGVAVAPDADLESPDFAGAVEAVVSSVQSFSSVRQAAKDGELPRRHDVIVDAGQGIIRSADIRRIRALMFKRSSVLRRELTALAYGWVADTELRAWMLCAKLVAAADRAGSPGTVNWREAVEELTVLQFLQLFPQPRPLAGLVGVLCKAPDAPRLVADLPLALRLEMGVDKKVEAHGSALIHVLERSGHVSYAGDKGQDLIQLTPEAKTEANARIHALRKWVGSAQLDSARKSFRDTLEQCLSTGLETATVDTVVFGSLRTRAIRLGLDKLPWVAPMSWQELVRLKLRTIDPTDPASLKAAATFRPSRVGRERDIAANDAAALAERGLPSGKKRKKRRGRRGKRKAKRRGRRRAKRKRRKSDVDHRAAAHFPGLGAVEVDPLWAHPIQSLGGLLTSAQRRAAVALYVGMTMVLDSFSWSLFLELVAHHGGDAMVSAINSLSIFELRRWMALELTMQDQGVHSITGVEADALDRRLGLSTQCEPGHWPLWVLTMSERLADELPLQSAVMEWQTGTEANMPTVGEMLTRVPEQLTSLWTASVEVVRAVIHAMVESAAAAPDVEREARLDLGRGEQFDELKTKIVRDLGRDKVGAALNHLVFMEGYVGVEQGVDASGVDLLDHLFVDGKCGLVYARTVQSQPFGVDSSFYLFAGAWQQTLATLRAPSGANSIELVSEDVRAGELCAVVEGVIEGEVKVEVDTSRIPPNTVPDGVTASVEVRVWSGEAGQSGGLPRPSPTGLALVYGSASADGAGAGFAQLLRAKMTERRAEHATGTRRTWPPHMLEASTVPKHAWDALADALVASPVALSFETALVGTAAVEPELNFAQAVDALERLGETTRVIMHADLLLVAGSRAETQATGDVLAPRVEDRQRLHSIVRARPHIELHELARIATPVSAVPGVCIGWIHALLVDGTLTAHVAGEQVYLFAPSLQPLG
ncbi:uncharacterized protein AMSG_12304 [Thecamonas trahens ATCC 50062]|uniref:B-block binding subunit of TFIIIC domain-containing protein n=1 Tax=Thecamonas trahens ATCC 50062 TaxID=461836 RepID=A0A0L0DPD8_THETB|nr:hypothetical protein AMSG_12304 [Thecamonas trahens ATCC 50062]KNC54162.1 hypothetical protein AMSG_12304 [Thecamonas trahens ATCC 50062]|eukprot:XP_013754012.1 hypothetical protein AMSG_12304 [Thecamonas trahens ATCC 50062]